MRLRKVTATVACALTCVLTCGAAMAELPVVTLVPSLPISSVKARGTRESKDESQESGEVLLDRQLPTGESFTIKLPVEADSTVSAVFEIWPAPESGMCAEPDKSSPQYRALGMTPVKSDSSEALQATVPALQVETNYCYRLRGRTTLSSVLISGMAESVADEIIADLKRDYPKIADEEGEKIWCARRTTKDVFVDKLRLVLKEESLDADPEVPARFAHSYFMTHDGLDECVAYAKKGLGSETDQDTVDREIKDAKAKIGTLPPVPPGASPLVLIPAASGGPDQLIEVGSPDCLDDKFIDACIAGLGKRDTVETQWATELTRLKAMPADKRAAALKKQAAPSEFELSTGKGGWMRLSTFQNTVAASGEFLVDPDAAQKQIELQITRLASAGSSDARLREWPQAIDGLQAELAKKKKIGSGAVEETQKRDLKQLLVRSFSDDPLSEKSAPYRDSLRVSFGYRDGQKQIGNNQTQQYSNYASVDLGVLAAAPPGGTSFSPWLVPYVGLNLYVTPVDRTIPFDQLAGSGWTRLAQRISVTLGSSVVAPSLPGRTTKSVLFGSYPLVALGFRLTQYTRMSLGGLFFQLADINPASSDSSLRVAPFVSFSLDFDVVNAVRGKASF